MDAPSPQARKLLGRVIQGSYFLREVLGEGSMGAVYRASRGGAPGDVAVKILWPHLASEADIKARFHREASTSHSVNHVNTVHVLSHGEDAGLSFLVMELVDGRTLFDALTEAGRMSSTRAARLMMQVANALTAAHAQGIVHRDLKPENVMVLGSPGDLMGERVKVVDFGIAKHLGAGADKGPQTMFGALIGTAGYMAPEQWRGGAIDARTDVYACGAMLYELVTGQQPFQGDDPIALGMLHLDEAPVRPTLLAPDLHPTLEAAILKALAKRPEDRHQSAQELHEHLFQALPAPPVDALAATWAFDAAAPPEAHAAVRALEPTPLPTPLPAAPLTIPPAAIARRRPALKVTAILAFAAIFAGIGALAVSLSAVLH